MAARASLAPSLDERAMKISKSVASSIVRFFPAAILVSVAVASCSSEEPYWGEASIPTDPPGNCPTALGDCSKPECSKDTDCPGPPDARCGERHCVDGTCSLTIYEGLRLASQRPGDCKTKFCSIVGEVNEIDDPSDVPDDGNVCTFDTCDPSNKPWNEPHREGEHCLKGIWGDWGTCVEGRCIECGTGDLQFTCPGDLKCQYDQCVPAHCLNGIMEPHLGETDQDDSVSPDQCGGECLGCGWAERYCDIGNACKDKVCVDGKCTYPINDCNFGSDCQSRICKDNQCTVATHNDGAQNLDETGADCGCAKCTKKCEHLEGCKTSADCLSDLCYAGICQKPTCTDGTKNGDEIGEDCGGPCAPCVSP